MAPHSLAWKGVEHHSSGGKSQFPALNKHFIIVFFYQIKNYGLYYGGYKIKIVEIYMLNVVVCQSYTLIILNPKEHLQTDAQFLKVIHENNDK